MTDEVEELLKEIKAYRNDMVARNYPFQRISDIITKWETRNIPGAIAPSKVPDFLDEAEKEKAELNESYKESVRQTNERKNFTPKAIDGYGE